MKRLVVALIGADGTGKTTLVDAFARTLDVKMERFYLGQKKFVLPLTGRWVASQGRFRSELFRWVLYPLDLRCRTLGMFIPKFGSRQMPVVLIDRLPMFPFEGRSWLLERIYRFALPRIDLLVLLTGDADLIYGRKAEGEKSELLRNMRKAELAHAAVPARRRLTLDVSRSVDQHVADIKEVLLDMNAEQHDRDASS